MTLFETISVTILDKYVGFIQPMAQKAIGWLNLPDTPFTYSVIYVFCFFAIIKLIEPFIPEKYTKTAIDILVFIFILALILRVI